MHLDFQLRDLFETYDIERCGETENFGDTFTDLAGYSNTVFSDIGIRRIILFQAFLTVCPIVKVGPAWALHILL